MAKATTLGTIKIATVQISARHKYAAALLNIAGVALTALIAVLASPFSWTGVDQLVLVVIGAITVFFAPLASIRWQGIWKTGAGVLVTVLTLIVPFITAGGITPAQIVTVALAALITLGNEIGVQIRTAPIDAGTAIAGQASTVTSRPPSA